MVSIPPSQKSQNEPGLTLPKSNSKLLSFLDWGRGYNRDIFSQDLLAALIVTVMLIPQSLAYALLAGLPPVVGLYASILPLVAYALFGTSRTLAVGPVAVLSLMTATATADISARFGADPRYIAVLLALLSGGVLLLLGVLRLGVLTNFLSHPVISGFITASGILIALSQLKHILGIKIAGRGFLETIDGLINGLTAVNLPTLYVGVGALVFLWWARSRLKPMLVRAGLAERTATLLSRAAPMLAVIVSTLLSGLLDLPALGVRVVGEVPVGLPALSVPAFDAVLWRELLPASALIAVIGFVESVSVAETLAAKRRQRIYANQELIGLGAANVASAISGGYPVTGGFARSAVNFDAGAQTPAAGVFTALGIALATLTLTPWFYYLPQATLAATIVVAVLSLVDVHTFKHTWRYSKADALTMLATILVTLFVGVEAGIVSGVLLSVAIFLKRTSRPHAAEVGLVEGTQHFRNVQRHAVVTCPRVRMVRVDESLYFANARFLEELLLSLVSDDEQVREIVLVCSAVNTIDASALETLTALNERLHEMGVRLHLCNVKGPVMDALHRSDFLSHLTGDVFLSQYAAYQQLMGEQG